MSYCPNPNTRCCPDYAAEYQPCCFSTSKPMVLPTYSERRARLYVGGAFFRSVYPGTLGSQVTVKSEWLDTNNIQTSSNIEMEYVRVTIEGIYPDGSTFSKEYTAQQTYNSGSDTWNSGIGGIRNQVNGDVDCVVSMPETDYNSEYYFPNRIPTSYYFQAGYVPSTGDPHPPTYWDGDYLEEFITTTLIGGDGPPFSGTNLDSINNSFVMSLCFIRDAEFAATTDPINAKLNEGGWDLQYTSVREWTGTNWRVYQSTC